MMNITPLGRLSIISLFAVLAMGAFAATAPISQAPAKAPAAATPATVTFHFSPPEGAVVVQTDKTSMTEKVNGQKRNEETDEAKMRVTFKKAAKGFTVSMSTISSSRTKDGKTVPPPELDPLKDVVLTYHLNNTGECTTLTGLDTIHKHLLEELEWKRVAQHKPAQLKAENAYIDQVINRMIRQRIGEWHDEFTRFCGKTVKIGDTWHDASPAQLPYVGNISLHRAITFADRVTMNGHNCVRLKYLITTDPAEIKAAIKKTAANMKKLAAAYHKTAPQTAMQDISVHQERTRIIDPATMLVYAESYAETQTMSVNQPKGKKAIAVTEEKRETVYEYK